MRRAVFIGAAVVASPFVALALALCIGYHGTLEWLEGEL